MTFLRVLPVLLLLLTHAGAAPLLLAVPSDAIRTRIAARLEGAHSETFARWEFVLGTYRGKQVIVTRVERDPLNAVAATTLALRHFQPSRILTATVGRRHDVTLPAGTWVVSRGFAAFDGIVSPRIPAGTGSNSLTWEVLPHLPLNQGDEKPELVFPADAALASALEKAVTVTGGRVEHGILGSAYQINREADRLAFLAKTWGTSTEDTTSAFVAGTAFLERVPVAGVVWVTGGDAIEETADEAGRLADVLVQSLEVLP